MALARDAIVRKVIPKALSEQSAGQPSWGERGKPFYDARMEMLALIPKGRAGARPRSHRTGWRTVRRRRRR